MLTTLDAVTKKTKSDPTREAVAPKEWVRLAKKPGLTLDGPNGLVGQLTKTFLETALNEDMTEHLGHEKNRAPDERDDTNVRNGTRTKTVISPTTRPVMIQVPRDRDGMFTPVIVPKRHRRLSGVDEIVRSLYARGLRPGRSALTLIRSMAPRCRRRPSPASRTRWSTRCRPGSPAP